MRRCTPLGALAALLLGTAPLAAQAPDSICVAAIVANADTLARLQLPGAELYPSQRRSRERIVDVARARCTPVKPDTVRVVYFDTTFVPMPPDTVWMPPPRDSSLLPPPGAPDSIAIEFDYTTSALWPSGSTGALANGAGTLCASVLVDGVLHLGDRAVSASIVSQDSVTFVARPEREASGLRALCDPIWRANGLELRRATPVWPVVWSSLVVILVERPVALPVAEAVLP